MKAIRLVMADDDPCFLKHAADYLSGTEEIDVVGCACDGFDAGLLIERERPDAVVLDMVLRKINGLSLMRSLRAMEPRPTLIVCSAFSSGGSVSIAKSLGVDFYVAKPVMLRHLHECIVYTVLVRRRMDEDARAVEKMELPDPVVSAVHRALISSGISPRLSGFSYLMEGLILLLNDHALLKNVSQRLYPRIAQSMNTSSGNVERNIRSAIRGAARRNGVEDPRHTNRQFISAVFRKILENQRSAMQ